MHATMRALLLLGIIGTARNQAISAELVGTYEKGAFALADDRLRFTVFTFAGKLTVDDVGRELKEVVKELRSTNRTAALVAATVDPPPAHQHTLKAGQVFVHGWVNITSGTYGWVAVTLRKMGGGYHLLTNDDARRDLVPADTGVTVAVKHWQPSPMNSHQVQFSLQVTAETIRWYAE